MNAVKLTAKQAAALEAIRTSPPRSGGFYRGLGHSIQTLAALERMGLVYSHNISFYAQKPINKLWSLTEKASS